MAKCAKKAPLYSLPHGIEVIGEYPPKGQNRYWRVRVKAHPFFSAPIVSGGQYVRRSRAIMSSILGRALLPKEVVHHKDEDVNNDSPDNLELTDHAAHNGHHKTGSAKSEISKTKASQSMKAAYREGRVERRLLRGTEQSQAKLDDFKVRFIRGSSESSLSLAKRFGVSKQTILAVKNHKTWRHIS